MPHVVTQACCGDASCVYACPVNCIHPTPDEPDFGLAEMLYIDPNTCVDCGACVTACPVSAIVPGHRISPEQARFAELNALNYAHLPKAKVRFPVDLSQRLPLAPVHRPKAIDARGEISVGIVGSGPAAMYAADELLRYPNVRVTIYERLSEPFGLARFGVAPDHQHTREVTRLFDQIAAEKRLTLLLQCEIGRDITLDELREQHRAVLWAAGASSDRPLPGAEDAPSATSFVGWYNGHPDFKNLRFDLSAKQATIIGNGNVALDVARIMISDPDRLAQTSIARHALEALRSSQIEEVVVTARRGPEFAAFTLPELVGLVDSGFAVVVDPADLAHLDPAQDTPKLAILREVAAKEVPAGTRRIRFAFGADIAAVIAAQPPLLLRAIGYRGLPVPGLPYDEATGQIVNVEGRVMDGDTHLPGVYVTGWAKRGPTGFIGTNKTDSEETVRAMLTDLQASAAVKA